MDELSGAARRHAGAPRKNAHAGARRRPTVASHAPGEGRGPGEPKPGLGRAQAETERPPAGLLANSLWTGSLRSRAVAAARIPLATYPLRYGAPFTICRRPPREGGRPGCRQHQQRGVTVTAPGPTNTHRWGAAPQRFPVLISPLKTVFQNLGFEDRHSQFTVSQRSIPDASTGALPARGSLGRPAAADARRPTLRASAARCTFALLRLPSTPRDAPSTA